LTTAITELVSGFVIHRIDDLPDDDGSIRVVSTDLDQQETETAQLSWLSTSEKVRAARLKSPLERHRYTASNVSTRRVLNGLTGILPENLEIFRDKCGKPYLTSPAAAVHPPSESPLKFSVSHSENCLCVATALGRHVGVDIEVMNPNLDARAISETCLPLEDIDRVRRSSLRERSLVFYRLWTRREAFAKMRGHGVNSDHLHRTPSLPWSLRSIEFTLGKKQIVGSFAIAAKQPPDEPFVT